MDIRPLWYDSIKSVTLIFFFHLLDTPNMQIFEQSIWFDCSTSDQVKSISVRHDNLTSQRRLSARDYVWINLSFLLFGEMNPLKWFIFCQTRLLKISWIILRVWFKIQSEIIFFLFLIWQNWNEFKLLER